MALSTHHRNILLGVAIGLAYAGLTAGLALVTGYDAIWSWYQFVMPGTLVLGSALAWTAAREGHERIAGIAIGVAAAALLVLVLGAIPAFLSARDDGEARNPGAARPVLEARVAAAA